MINKAYARFHLQCSRSAEVHFAEQKPAESPTGAVTGRGTSFRQIEFAGILKGTRHPDLAGKLIDFLLSASFQEDIPLQMFVFPASASVELPEVFQKHAVSVDHPVVLSPEQINAGREKWIQAWTKIVIR